MNLVEADGFNAEELQHGEQSLADVAEGNRAVMGVAALDQDVAVEAVHLGDGEHADAAEGLGRHGQDLALGDVGLQHAVLVALEAIEGDLAGSDVALEGAAGDVGSAAVLQQTVLDQLVLNSAAGAHLAGRSIAAVEAHEGVGQLVRELALDALLEHILRDGVVDIEQSNGILADNFTDVLGQCAVDIHFTGHGNPKSRLLILHRGSPSSQKTTPSISCVRRYSRIPSNVRGQSLILILPCRSRKSASSPYGLLWK